MKTYGDVDMQLNTHTEKFVAAAPGVMCHHYTINQKHVLYRNKLPIYDFNYKRLLHTESPVISAKISHMADWEAHQIQCNCQNRSNTGSLVLWGLKRLDTCSQEVINMERVLSESLRRQFLH